MTSSNVKEFREEDSTLNHATFLSKNLDHLREEIAEVLDHFLEPYKINPDNPLYNIRKRAIDSSRFYIEFPIPGLGYYFGYLGYVDASPDKKVEVVYGGEHELLDEPTNRAAYDMFIELARRLERSCDGQMLEDYHQETMIFDNKDAGAKDSTFSSHLPDVDPIYNYMQTNLLVKSQVSVIARNILQAIDRGDIDSEQPSSEAETGRAMAINHGGNDEPRQPVKIKRGDSGHYSYSPEGRRDIARQYWKAYKEGRIINRDAWASQHGITRRTLKKYLVEFPEESFGNIT